jgi:hypothetical protein
MAITVRVNKVIGDENGLFASAMLRLFSLATNKEVLQVIDSSQKVDIQIEPQDYSFQTPSLSVRVNRTIGSYLPSGIDFSNRKNSPNQQPVGNARYSFYWTGENERPPQGKWDGYFTFDTEDFGGRNIYLPLWWITTTDLFGKRASPWLGRSVTLKELTSTRTPQFETREKFCVAFIGKAYSYRLHTLEALSKISRVDVFGPVNRRGARSNPESKLEIAKNYRFMLAFENDLYPGYVTEKAPEAWATGAIPLYYGMESEKYFNPTAMINALDFVSLSAFTSRVAEVNSSREKWTEIASQPLLQRTPSLEPAITRIREIIKPLLAG